MVKIQDYTTLNPLQMIGKEAGICWNAPTDSTKANKRRAIDCIKSNHGRVIEFPDVYMIIEGYSARVIREFYTHIGGSPTRLQASTRYIDCNGFNYVYPPMCDEVRERYEEVMHTINVAYGELISLGMKKEDAANILPLGMETKIVVKINARTLMDMSRQRMCNRAYWEFRKLFNEICDALRNYSEEWDYLVTELFMPKCDALHYCPEKNGCGRHRTKAEFEKFLIEGTYYQQFLDDGK